MTISDKIVAQKAELHPERPGSKDFLVLFPYKNTQRAVTASKRVVHRLNATQHQQIHGFKRQTQCLADVGGAVYVERGP